MFIFLDSHSFFRFYISKKFRVSMPRIFIHLVPDLDTFFQCSHFFGKIADFAVPSISLALFLPFLFGKQGFRIGCLLKNFYWAKTRNIFMPSRRQDSTASAPTTSTLKEYCIYLCSWYLLASPSICKTYFLVICLFYGIHSEH